MGQFFRLSFFPPGADAGFTKGGGGAAHPEPQRRQPRRPMWRGGGGGRRSKHWPPGAGDPRYATGRTGPSPKFRNDIGLF